MLRASEEALHSPKNALMSHEAMNEYDHHMAGIRHLRNHGYNSDVFEIVGEHIATRSSKEALVELLGRHELPDDTTAVDAYFAEKPLGLTDTLILATLLESEGTTPKKGLPNHARTTFRDTYVDTAKFANSTPGLIARGAVIEVEDSLSITDRGLAELAYAQQHKDDIPEARQNSQLGTTYEIIEYLLDLSGGATYQWAFSGENPVVDELSRKFGITIDAVNKRLYEATVSGKALLVGVRMTSVYNARGGSQYINLAVTDRGKAYAEKVSAEQRKREKLIDDEKLDTYDELVRLCINRAQMLGDTATAEAIKAERDAKHPAELSRKEFAVEQARLEKIAKAQGVELKYKIAEIGHKITQLAGHLDDPDLRLELIRNHSDLDLSSHSPEELEAELKHMSNVLTGIKFQIARSRADTRAA